MTEQNTVAKLRELMAARDSEPNFTEWLYKHAQFTNALVIAAPALLDVAEAAAKAHRWATGEHGNPAEMYGWAADLGQSLAALETLP